MPKKKQKMEVSRVVVVGAGFVGATSAYAIMCAGIASEVVLIDVNKKKAKGEAMDMEHGISFVEPVKVWAGDYKDCADADIIVITAGVNQKAGQTRMELAKTNKKIMKDIARNIRKHTKDAIVLVVSNPLDVTTYTVLKELKFPKGHVFGTGTSLDSSRLRFLIAQKFGVAAESVEAYLIGEHGDTEVPVFSHANIEGEHLSKMKGYSVASMRKAFFDTKNAAYEIIERKGATYYSIALAVTHIVRAILFNEKIVIPVSVHLTGQYGISDVCLSLPAIIGRNGVEKILELSLSKEEQKLLKKSADAIKDGIKS